MADLSDVEKTVVTIVGNILVPGGVPVLSYPVKIYRGFPSATKLDPDLQAGISHVCVNEAAGYSRQIAGYIDQPTDSPGIKTLTVAISGAARNIVTFVGSANASQIAGIKVNGVAYGYAVLANDTPSTVAAALAALSIAGGVTPSISGPVLTFANGVRLDARTGAVGTSVLLPRYMASGIRIMVFAFSPDARDVICSYIDSQFAANNRFITLPDGQSSHMCWRNTYSDDMPQKELCWRRDLLYTVEYATSLTVNAPAMLWGVENITPQSGTGVNLIGTPVQINS